MKQTETDFNPIATALIASVKVIFADLRKVISFRDAGGVFTFICRG